MADHPIRIKLGYVQAQLAKASGTNADRAARWAEVLRGLFDGRLDVGSRTPVTDTPAWVTLEVLHGGFASGHFAAAGPILPHEQERLSTIERPAGLTERAALNLHFLSPAGRAELEQRLADGRYRVHVPEEGALLAVAWLLQRGEVARAERLVSTIAPFFDRLRFYPAPHPRPLRSQPTSHVQTVAEVIDRLRARRPRGAISQMHEALTVWAPLFDEVLALWLATVEGEQPTFERDARGAWVRGADGQPVVTGGTPGRRTPPDWSDRARALLDVYAERRARHRLCRKPDDPNENFAILRRLLGAAIESPAALSEGQVRQLRKVLASEVARHGAPGSEQRTRTREMQRGLASQPPYPALAQVLAARLAPLPHDDGVSDVDPLLAPLAADEAARLGCRDGAPLPEVLRETAMRCLDAPLETLVERRLIGSSEALASHVPVVSAQASSAASDDPALQRLYGALYVAFRHRRSLLLLDLQSQVRLGELPWVAELEPWLRPGAEARAAARETLCGLSTLALSRFPFTITPNKLVKELRALAKAAELDLPLVEELAADIFMGAFAGNFLAAGKVAAALLEGTLYERYYAVPFARVRALEDVARSPQGASSSPGFAAICEELAGPSIASARSSPASNGRVIEQGQIVTTHNLASLFHALELGDRLDLPALARHGFEWICHRLQRLPQTRHGQLRWIKRCAYAWRQLIFFAALLEPGELDAFLAWATGHLENQRPSFRERFAPAVEGLRIAARGEVLQDDSPGARRFLGWTLGPHWLQPTRS
jgi:hypothetical protein